MRFSERLGIIKAKEAIQIDQMDSNLKNGLWNIFQISFLDKTIIGTTKQSQYAAFFYILWHDFFKLTIDSIPYRLIDTKSYIKNWFFEKEWFEIYDFIEFVTTEKSPTDSNSFMTHCNAILERELSAYRFVNGVLSQITSEQEIAEIDLAIKISTEKNLIGVKTHLESALKKMVDRKSPDYRNSIKESISAVESISKIISNNSKDSLGGALDKIKGKINLHPSLEKGFKQIYGYTSDADGIRHALTEQSNCDFEDAKYMLVSSSAFVNYLISKAEKAGISI